MNRDLALIQVGCVDEDVLEMVDLIHQFKTSADFADWITDQKFKNVIHEQKIGEGKYSRIFQYELEEEVFFQGKIEVETDKIPKEMIQALNTKSPLLTSIPSFSQAGKMIISRILAEPYYTIVSRGLYRNVPNGMCWEIYHLTQLLKIYKNKNDPMRYWRRTRRE